LSLVFYYKSSVGISDFFGTIFLHLDNKNEEKKGGSVNDTKDFFLGGVKSWAQITILRGKRILKSPYKKQ
jgi:hypothetical protein